MIFGPGTPWGGAACTLQLCGALQGLTSRQNFPRADQVLPLPQEQILAGPLALGVSPILQDAVLLGRCAVHEGGPGL